MRQQPQADRPSPAQPPLDPRAIPARPRCPLPRIFSAHAYLLPFLEQGVLEGHLDYFAPPADFTVPPATVYDGSRNFAAASTAMKVFSCPADPARGRVTGSVYGGTNYAGNAGSGAAGGSLSVGDGVFHLASRVRLEDVLDGTSMTVAFAERSLGDPRRAMRELPGSADPTPAACDASGAGVWNQERGAKWIVGNYGNTLYNHALPPNAPAWDCLNATQQKARSAARSDHQGGVNVLTCDGGVRFVADGVTLETWRALATRAGADGRENPF